MTREQIIVKFKEQYLVVFDSMENIKVCGRENTIKLIKLAYLLDSDTDYGNINTGFLNKENIIKLVNTI